MTFHATVVQVLIASPGDTQAERAAILAQASRWNGRYARGRGFVLSPWLYELHSTPLLGERPQAIINSQGVDKSDVVVAVFSARLGSDAGINLTGTEEEIKRARENGVPVHVYFSDAGFPNEVNVEQLAKLQEFKRSLESQGLYATFSDPEDLARKVIEALEFDLDVFDAVPPPAPPSGVDLRFEHQHQEKQVGVNKRGKPQTRSTVRDLVVTNAGDATAHGLRLLIEVPEDNRLSIDDDELDEDGWTRPRDLPGKSSFGILCFPMARRTNAIVTARWTEDGDDKERTVKHPVPMT